MSITPSEIPKVKNQIDDRLIIPKGKMMENSFISITVTFNTILIKIECQLLKAVSESWRSEISISINLIRWGGREREPLPYAHSYVKNNSSIYITDDGRGKSINVCWSIVICPTVFNKVTMLVNRPLHVTFLQNNNVGHFTLAA